MAGAGGAGGGGGPYCCCCGGAGRVLTMADIHSSTSFWSLVMNQSTCSPGLRPTAITCSSLTLSGRRGLPGTRAEYWPAASRSGLSDSLIPPSGEEEEELVL